MTDKDKKERIDNRWNTASKRKIGRQTFQSRLFTLAHIDLSLSEGLYQAETSLWGPGPTHIFLDWLVIDTYRSRVWSNLKRGYWVWLFLRWKNVWKTIQQRVSAGVGAWDDTVTVDQSLSLDHEVKAFRMLQRGSLFSIGLIYFCLKSLLLSNQSRPNVISDFWFESFPPQMNECFMFCLHTLFRVWRQNIPEFLIPQWVCSNEGNCCMCIIHTSLLQTT